MKFSLRLRKLADFLYSPEFSPSLQTYLESLESKYGLKIGKFLNSGSNGFIFRSDIKGKPSILKLTKSLDEIACAKKIYQKRLWNQTKHLPEVYLAGDLPSDSFLMNSMDEELKSLLADHVFGFYVRESVAPLKAKTPSLPGYLKNIVYKIESETGLTLTDIFPDNFGKTSDGRIVYFDLECK